MFICRIAFGGRTDAQITLRKTALVLISTEISTISLGVSGYIYIFACESLFSYLELGVLKASPLERGVSTWNIVLTPYHCQTSDMYWQNTCVAYPAHGGIKGD